MSIALIRDSAHRDQDPGAGTNLRPTSLVARLEFVRINEQFMQPQRWNPDKRLISGEQNPAVAPWQGGGYNALSNFQCPALVTTTSR